MGLFASKPAPYADGETSITIVGAGLVGSLLAVVLRSKGYDVRIFERYGDIRAIPSVGRSINLVATVRGLRALRALPPDVCERLLQLGTKVTGRVIHTTDGEALFQRYGKDDSEFNYSISRYELNKFLLSEAERAGAEIRRHRLAAEKFLEEAYGDALAHLGGAKRAAEQLVKNPRGILGTVRTKTWAFGGKLALVGDAAHAIVPFFGQGMNCGFEDVDVLCALLEAKAPPGSAAPDFAGAFAEYEAKRKRNANAIADMALENYVEMMDRTGDPDFRKAKAVENALENSALGSRFRSRYAMVCYGGGRQPGGVQYDDALQLGKVQWDIVCELAAGLDDPENAAEHLDEAKAAAPRLEARAAPGRARRRPVDDLARLGLF
ncbi:FAD binding protein [Aureococcus anophagefferens]|nr:FAD binding protein [Aureococcus anophagefferens]